MQLLNICLSGTPNNNNNMLMLPICIARQESPAQFQDNFVLLAMNLAKVLHDKEDDQLVGQILIWAWDS